MDLTWLIAPPAAPSASSPATAGADTVPGAASPRMPRQRQLCDRLRAAVLDGRLAPGSRLPASRTLAADLGVARNTVLHAYEQLTAEGVLQASRHGTRVAALPIGIASPSGSTSDTKPPSVTSEASPAAEHGPTHLRAARRATAPTAAITPPAEPDAATVDSPGLSRRARGALRLEAPAPSLLPFACGVPDVASFPIRAWRASLDRAWRQASARHLAYAPPGGEPALRQALAVHLSTLRGMAVTPGQLIITSGIQSGLELCARLLADVGDTAWVEDPGYPAARSALAMAGLQLHGVRVDGEGLAPTAADWARHPPRLIFLTPSHQYPTGAVLSMGRRLALLRQAQAHGAWILEDDYDSEFRRGGAPLPALLGLRTPGEPHDPRVIYLGTFSKTLMPALRLGYLVVPPALAEVFARAAAETFRPGQGIEQLALADFIARGDHTRHLRRMRRVYAGRREALRAALAHHFSTDRPVTGGDAGLHLTLWWRGAPLDSAVADAALALGVLARPLSRYALNPLQPEGAQGLVLGYGVAPEERIDGAVRRLRQAWEEAAQAEEGAEATPRCARPPAGPGATGGRAGP